MPAPGAVETRRETGPQGGAGRYSASRLWLDPASGDLARRGYGVVSHSGATAFLAGNSLARNPHPVGAFAGRRFGHDTAAFERSMAM